jgi:type VI secretion system secreted protein Hcp
MRSQKASGRVAGVLSFGIAVAASFSVRADIITLQLPNVPGDAKFAANHGLPPDSIRVLTVGNSVENSGAGGTGGGGGAGKAIFSDLSIVKKFGESSAQLFLLVAQGAHLPTATVSFYRAKQGVPAKYYTITLQDVIVAAQQWVGNSNGVDAADSESVSLTYSRITLTNNETGSSACYDVRLNMSC